MTYMSNDCCNNKQTSNTCCTNNVVKDNNCYNNETHVTNSKNDNCSNNETYTCTSQNSTNLTNNKYSEENDKVATSVSNYNFKVNGMDCSSCARTIEKALSPLDEVTNPKVNFSTGKLTVGLKSQNDINQVTQTVRKLGYDVEETKTNSKYITFSVEGMDCGSCAKSIEKHLNNLSYVNDAQVSFSTGKMQVDFEGNKTKNIEKEVSKIGYSATLSPTKKSSNSKWNLIVSKCFKMWYV